jgi:AAA domain
MLTQHHIAKVSVAAPAVGALQSAASTASVSCPHNAHFLPPHLDKIPPELKKKRQWVVWRAEGQVGTKPVKIPYDPALPNSRAKSNDPQTWGTYDQAEAAYLEGTYTGFGFVLNGNGIVGIDIDNCVVDAVPSTASMDLMCQLGVQYIELSPSGTGLRGFGYAEKLDKGVNGKVGDLKVELYSDLRFLTVTGHVLSNGPLSQLHGFTELADKIRVSTITTANHGASQGVHEDRHAMWFKQVISGEVYHDALRDLAGSMIASGMQPGAVVSSLRGLMESSHGPHDDRWKARKGEIPKLVDSAAAKFSPGVVDVSRILQQVKLEEAASDEDQRESRFKVLSAAEVAQSAPIAWTIRGLLPKTGLAALYGASGSGKSFLALDMGASIAAGLKEWYGLRISKCPVTYCVLEGEAGMGKRVAAWEAHSQNEIAEMLRFIAQPFDITVASDVQELAAAIRAAGGTDGLIVLDTLNRAAPGADENSSKDMGEIIANAKALQQLTGGLVLLVHHTGKDETKGMLGHSSLFAAMDAVVAVMNSKDKGLSWGVAKSKDDVTGTFYPFRLEQVVVGTDDEGEDVTSCVAVSIAPPFALRKSKQLGQHQQAALQVLGTLFESAGEQSANIHMDAAVKAVADAVNAGPKHKRLRAKEAIEALALKQYVVIDEYRVRPGPNSK